MCGRVGVVAYAWCEQTRAHLRCGVNRTRNSLSDDMRSVDVLECLQIRQRTLVFRLVQPVNDDVALADPKSIEILPYSQCQLIFLYSPFRFRACHGRRHASYALVEDDVTERVLEGRRGVEAVGSAVALEDGRLLRCPFHLLERHMSAFGARCGSAE